METITRGRDPTQIGNSIGYIANEGSGGGGGNGGRGGDGIEGGGGGGD